jgi:IS1 family transposase
MQKIGGIWKPKKKTKILLYLRDGWRGTGWLMQKIGGIWKPKKKTKILIEGWRGTGWVMQKFGGIWKPKKKTKILLEGRMERGELAGWCRKLAGSENPKKKLRFYLRDGWRGTGWLMQKFGGIWKPKKKTKILLEGRMEGNWLGDAENWRDLKTQKKN